ncbi:MAG TPA: hypothetical protein VFF52_18050 [Isosphaeraceae bacterium]|nr:hypothetical protein [Isosphaeraceae bacterium]
MTDQERSGAGAAPGARTEPRPSRLRQILQERPEARSRLSRAVASLLAIALVALGAIGALVIWHLVRRGRLIRERLSPPRIVRIPEFPGPEVTGHDPDHDAASTA